MRLDTDGLTRMQHELTAARREQRRSIERIDRWLAAIPKKERRLGDAIFEAGERLIPAFKALTGLGGILGNPDIMGAFDLGRVRGRNGATLEEIATEVVGAPARPPRGVPKDEADVRALTIELVAFAVNRGALRAEPTPEMRHLSSRVEALHERISDLGDERRLLEPGRELCVGTLREMEAASEVVVRCLHAVRRHEALVREKAEMARKGGRRRAASAARDDWGPRLEAKRAELADLRRRTEDVRWDTVGEKEHIRAFFKEHPGRGLLMASILRNVPLLCGGLVKSDMTEVTPFEVGVAAREHASALRLLDDDDPLRTASWGDRMYAFRTLEAAPEALGSFNAVNRNLEEVTRLRRETARAREELGDLERAAARAAEEAARAHGERVDEVRARCSAARQEAKVRRGEVRGFYLDLRRRCGLRHGWSGFPETHAAMLAELVCGDVQRRRRR